MEYIELRTIEQAVNTRGTKLWTKMNDNSKSESNRHRFVQEHGGFFVREGRYWKWNTPVTERNGYWLKRVDTGEKTFFSNMAEFAEQQGMTSVKVCELLNGKRKTYKGWTAVEVREVKDDVGPRIKEKEEKPKKVGITKAVTFYNRVTKEIIPVSNVSEFAKANNIDSNALYKVSRGALKSYKNLELYNPLKIISDSPET
jgi:hypothetical protein